MHFQYVPAFKQTPLSKLRGVCFIYLFDINLIHKPLSETDTIELFL